MEFKWAFWLYILILGVSLITSFLISSQFTQANPTESPLETCKPLYNNGEGKINLVFFSDQKTTKEYADFLLETHPLDEKKDSFNIFYIDDYEPSCELYQGIAVLCHNRETISKAASCPNDFIFAITDHPKQIRATAYRNVVSLNKNLPFSVITHELGHVLVNFAEEYVEERARIPSGSKNCQQECTDFDRATDGCFEGCTSSSHKRSIENGVMRTLSSNEFGTFNEQIIREKIDDSVVQTSPLTGNAISLESHCSEKSHGLIEAQYNQGEIEILKVTEQQGCFPRVSSGHYTYSLDENTLGSEFNPEIIFSDSLDSGGSLDPEGVPFFLQVPQTSQTLTVTDEEGKEVISQYSLSVGGQPCLA